MPAPLARPDDEEEATILPIKTNDNKILDEKIEMIPYIPDDNYGFSKKAITTQVLKIFYRLHNSSL